MAVILITGGARSGKSARAEKRARSFPGQPVYIATAEALDAEMEARIAKHRARARNVDWIEREVPLDLLHALIETDGGGARLVDCLTLWLSNLMHAERDWEHEVMKLAAAPARPEEPRRFRHQRSRPRHRARQCAGAQLSRRRRNHEPGHRGGCRRSRVRRGRPADETEMMPRAEFCETSSPISGWRHRS